MPATAAAALVVTGCGGGADGPGVVRVAVGRPGLLDEAATGFAVHGGRVVTVAHVLDDDEAVQVDGRLAVTTRDDVTADLALLAVRGPAPRPAAAASRPACSTTVTVTATATSRPACSTAGPPATATATRPDRSSSASCVTGPRATSRPASCAA